MVKISRYFGSVSGSGSFSGTVLGSFVVSAEQVLAPNTVVQTGEFLTVNFSDIKLAPKLITDSGDRVFIPNNITQTLDVV